MYSYHVHILPGMEVDWVDLEVGPGMEVDMEVGGVALTAAKAERMMPLRSAHLICCFGFKLRLTELLFK